MALDTFTAEVPKEIEEHAEYKKWFEDLDGSQSPKVEAARSKIETEGLITSAKSLGDGLYEIKWNSGLRVYFAVIEKNGNKTLLLLGSGKGYDQTQAITKAKQCLQNYNVLKHNIKKQG